MIGLLMRGAISNSPRDNQRYRWIDEAGREAPLETISVRSLVPQLELNSVIRCCGTSPPTGIAELLPIAGISNS